MIAIFSIITVVLVYFTTQFLGLTFGDSSYSSFGLSECILMTFMVFALGTLEDIRNKLDK